MIDRHLTLPETAWGLALVGMIAHAHALPGNLDKLDSSTRVIVTGVQHVPEIF